MDGLRIGTYSKDPCMDSKRFYSSSYKEEEEEEHGMNTNSREMNELLSAFLQENRTDRWTD